MSSSSLTPFFTHVFAQAAGAAGTAATATPDAASSQGSGGINPLIYIPLFAAMIYFALIRPQTQAKKKQEEILKSAKTGDKIVTTGGIHGVITNVKETTVIVRVADNVKLEIEKSHLDKITRADADSEKTEKTVTAKVS